MRKLKIKKHLLFIFCNLSFVLLFSGCGLYSFTGTSISPEVKTVSVQYFNNYAPIVQPTLSQLLTETLKERFQNQTRLTLVERGGDLNFKGTITGYSTSPAAIQSNETAALNQLTITITVKFTNSIDEKQNFEKTFTRFEQYSSKQNFSSVEASIDKQIVDALVDDIFNNSVINW
ncbi:MAG: LptE family protein [Bacteroidota bacterium]|nr:LptE family protein [Bacteroidota bacterium]